MTSAKGVGRGLFNTATAPINWLYNNIAEPITSRTYDHTIGEFGRALPYESEVLIATEDYVSDVSGYRELSKLITQLSLTDHQKASKIKNIAKHSELLESLTEYSNKFSDDEWEFNLPSETLKAALDKVKSGATSTRADLEELYNHTITEKEKTILKSTGTSHQIQDDEYGEGTSLGDYIGPGWDVVQSQEGDNKRTRIGKWFKRQGKKVRHAPGYRWNGKYKEVEMSIQDQLSFLLKEKKQELRKDFISKISGHVDTSYADVIEGAVSGEKTIEEIEKSYRDAAYSFAIASLGFDEKKYKEKLKSGERESGEIEKILAKEGDNYTLSRDEVYNDFVKPAHNNLENYAKKGAEATIGVGIWSLLFGPLALAYPLISNAGGIKEGLINTASKGPSRPYVSKLKNTAKVLYNVYNDRIRDGRS